MIKHKTAGEIKRQLLTTTAQVYKTTWHKFNIIAAKKDVFVKDLLNEVLLDCIAKYEDMEG